MTDSKITQLTATTALQNTDLIPVVQNVSTVPVTKAVAVLDLIKASYQYQTLNLNPDGRLTLSSTSTTADATGATTLYYLPHVGNRIWLYTGAYWKPYTFTSVSISLSGLAALTNYDVFIYDNSGTLTLNLVAWLDNVTRATSLAKQDGVYVKTGALNYRYLGTIRTTSTIGQCEDSSVNRFVWNYYNRLFRKLDKTDTTHPHTYTTATWRSWNGASDTLASYVCGVVEETVAMFIRVSAVAASAISATNIGIGNNGSISEIYVFPALVGGDGAYATLNAPYNYPRTGYGYFEVWEKGSTGVTYNYGMTYVQWRC